MKKSKLLKNKKFIEMINHIEEHVGEFHTGTLIAILCDSLNNVFKETDSEACEIRTMEITYNDFYSTKFNFETNKFEEE